MQANTQIPKATLQPHTKYTGTVKPKSCPLHLTTDALPTQAICCTSAWAMISTWNCSTLLKARRVYMIDSDGIHHNQVDLFFQKFCTIWVLCIMRQVTNVKLIQHSALSQPCTKRVAKQQLKMAQATSQPLLWLGLAWLICF